MTPFQFSALCLCLVAFAQYIDSQSTVTPTREPMEHESFFFMYDPKPHMLGVAVSANHQRTCYITTIKGQDRVAVHSATGMKNLELRLISHINRAHKTQTTPAALMATSQLLAHKCNHTTAIYQLDLYA